MVLLVVVTCWFVFLSLCIFFDFVGFFGVLFLIVICMAFVVVGSC